MVIWLCVLCLIITGVGEHCLCDLDKERELDFVTNFGCVTRILSWS